MEPWVYVVLGIIIFIIAPGISMQFIVAKKLYEKYMIRSESENWSRELIPTEPEEEVMYKECEEFEKINASYKQDVTITSDGFKLVGEYYNFGFKRACIVVAGRSEALRYSYYFAQPYKEAGFNILVIDNRSHGFSEGKYNSLGLKEYRDLLGWAKLLHDDLANDYVIGHGICIGSATLLYAMTNDACPSYFKGLIADGMYVNFPTSFNNHAYEAGYPAHPVTEIFFMYFKHNTKENPYYGPKDCIDKMDKPILFLYSKQDNYSKPDKGQFLYDICKSDCKEIEWFEIGKHSHIRVNNKEKYDESIKRFVNKYFK